MLDTNVFNDACDGKMPAEAFSDRKITATGVQLSELRATKNLARRDELLAKFLEIGPTSTLAASGIWGLDGAGWGQARWNDGSGTFQSMLARLKELDAVSRKKSKDEMNQIRDIVIAETALKLRAILVSNDNNLRKLFFEFGGTAINAEKFANQSTIVEAKTLNPTFKN